jgi:hypothetical protein
MDLASIPPAFVALHRAGRFDYWGAPYHSLSNEQRAERGRSRVTHVLSWNGIEWDRDLDEIVAFEGDDQLRPGLIPFAGNGFGDQYCWYPRWQVGDEPPVIFAVHDEEESRLFARTFAECLCRCMLQSFADEDESADHHGIPRPRLWHAHREILRPHLTREQNEMLDELGLNPSRDRCNEADDRIAAAVGDRKLIGIQLASRYADDYFSDTESLLRCYDSSIAFYRELVEIEGLEQFRPRLEEARAARAAAASRDRRK